MALRSLIQHNNSGRVTLPVDDLRSCGVIDENGEIRDDQQISVKEIGEGAWLLRVPDENGDVPPLEDCEVLQRLVGQLMYKQQKAQATAAQVGD